MQKYKIAIVLMVAFLNILASVYIFSNGFLIRRTALSNTNQQQADKSLIKSSKAIILFVDALRFDFIFNDGNYFGIKTIQSLLRSQPARSRLYKFVADPPTTTMQRIKAMMSGTLPTFIDAGANFNSYLVDDDNLIRQLSLNNKSVVILGDDTWLSLFPKDQIAWDYTFPSFNIKDLDTNDREVDKELSHFFTKSASHPQWSLIIAHYLGLDHCGHTFGPKNINIKRKLNDIDNSIKKVVEFMDDDTLLIIFGDHGMTDVGDHGGDSQLEVESALFFYSKRDIFTVNRGEFKEIKQIDLTPTLALALGVPIPFSNLGVVISDFFDQLDHQNEALEANYHQVKQFVETYETVESLFDETKLLRDSDSSMPIVERLQLIQSKFREKWSSFNLSYCLIGIVSLCLSILTSLLVPILTWSKFLFKAIIYSLIYAALSLLSPVLASLTVIVFNLDLLITNRSFLFSKCRESVFDKQHYTFLAVSFLIPFSNSFVINENVSLRFLLVSLAFVEALHQYKNNLKSVASCKLLLFAILTRISVLFHVCREEVMSKCTQYIFATQIQKMSSINKPVYTLFILFNFACIFLVIRHVFPKSRSIFKWLFGLQFAALCFYNLFELEHSNLESLIISSKLDNQMSIHNELTEIYLSQLKWINIQLARLVYLLFAIGQLIIWSDQSASVLDRIARFSISFGFLASLVLSETKLSIWILIFILNTFIRLPLDSISIDPYVFIFLLQHYFFYGTGHEATFTHIKWESGFHGVYGDMSNQFVSNSIMGGLITINTFCSTILVSFTLALFARTQTSLKFALFNSLKMLSSVVSVFVLRRHLMVWKIFAPRFVFDLVSLLVGFIVTISGLVLS